MTKEFKVKKFKDATVYTLESASGGGTSAGAVASVSSPVGGVQRRASLVTSEEKKDAPKPRNFVAKNAKMGGAGAHKDKKKDQKQGKEKHKKPYMEELKDRIDALKLKLAENSDLAQQMMATARSLGMNPRLRGTPDQERERTQQMLAQRAKDREEQGRQAAQADADKLPELKAEYAAMKKEYESLGGSNWQYADREQNLSDAERKARSMEPQLRTLASRIHRAEQGVTEGLDPAREKIGRIINKYFGKIYDGGDDALDYLDSHAPTYSQIVHGQYEGDLDSAIAEQPIKILKQIAFELKNVASDIPYMFEQGVMEDEYLNHLNFLLEEKQRLDPSCWKGYKKQGTKMKGGVRVNNCVPKEDVETPSALDKFRNKLASQGYSSSQQDRLKDREQFRQDREQDRENHRQDQERNRERHQNRMDAGHDTALNWERNRQRRDDAQTQHEIDWLAYRLKKMDRDDDDWEKTFDMLRDRINRYQYSTQRDVDPEQLAAITNITYNPKRKKSDFVPTDESINRKTDSNGRTQAQWIQAVNTKFPDARIMQAKMLDGPCFAMLPDGRKLSWKPVEDDKLNQKFDVIESMIEDIAAQNGVDVDQVWEDVESIDDQELLAEAEAWQTSKGKSKTGGLNKKGVASYRRSHPGSKLQTAVTTKPSKLKKGSKAAKRRKSFCARMGGVKGPMKKPNGKPTRKALALRKWNCHEDAYVLSMAQQVSEKLNPQADVDVWVQDFQKADPNKYHQFKNKTPQKKAQMAVAAHYAANEPSKKK
jgi:hypothetical protein